MSAHPGTPIPRGKGAVTQHPWPDDCFLQAGLKGLVFSRNPDQPSYTTAFVEAFPTNPRTFLRGEGDTVEPAEDAAWAKWKRILTCPAPTGHEYETRGYKNGGGFCKHCNLFTSGAFLVSEVGDPCVVCGTRTNWAVDDGKQYCETHTPAFLCPGCSATLTRTERIFHECGEDLDAQLTDDEVQEGIAAVLTRLTQAEGDTDAV